MKKIFAILLLMAMVVGLFAGCGKDGGKSDKTVSVEDVVPASDDIFTKDKVDFVTADGKSVYGIIRPEKCLDGESTSASKIFKAMKSTLGAASKNTTDAEDGTDAYEILIGNTNRPETAEALKYLGTNGGMRKDDFVIGSMGKKIVIVGVTDAATLTGAEYFIANFLKKEGVDGGILYANYTDATKYTERKINGIALGHFKVVRPHYNSSYITQLEIERMLEIVSDKLGYVVPIVEDAYEEPGSYEIIVGNTNREGVRKIENRDEFEIRIEGTKVYLNGGHNYSTAAAVTEFAKLISEKDITNDASVAAGSYSKVVETYDKATYFTPVWYDDFDGTTINEKLWKVVKPGESDSAGYANKRCVRSADPNITFVRDGLFQIHPFQDDTTYYGGMLRTNGTMNYTYGYAELSERIPNAPGFWTALWTCSNEPDSMKIQSPEIDINESFGNGNVVAANCHKWPTAAGKDMGYEHTSLDGATYGNAKRRYSLDGKSFNDDFHTFGFLWDNSQMTFTCDGEIYFAYDTTQTGEDVECFNHSLYFILSMAVGFANNGEDITKATDEDWQTDRCCLFVDHFYLYQLKDGIQTINVRE